MSTKPKFDLYDELGVARDASPATIRKAYRRRAKKAHPDAGGSAEAFERTRTALAVLSDDRRRRDYDRTGAIDDDLVDNAISNALQVIAQVIQVRIMRASRGEESLATVNVIGYVKRVLTEAVDKCLSRLLELDVCDQAADTIASRSVRVRPLKEGKPDAIAHVIRGQKRIHELERQAIRDKIDAIKLALPMLDDYRYTVDDTRPYAYAGGISRSILGFTDAGS